MTKEDLPITPPPRPADPFTSQDGLRLFSMIDARFKDISSSFENYSNRLAIVSKQNIDIIKLLETIEAESNESRLGRLQLEIEEAERDLEIIERQKRAAEEKLSQKQTIKDKSTDTGERIKAIASEAISDVDQKKKKAREEWLEDLRRSIIKAVLISLSVSAVGTLVAFIWFLIQLYMNRGAP